MKKVSLIFATVVAVCLWISCEKHESMINSNVTKVEVSSPFDDYGSNHNEILMEIGNNLQNSYDLTDVTITDKLRDEIANDIFEMYPSLLANLPFITMTNDEISDLVDTIAYGLENSSFFTSTLSDSLSSILSGLDYTTDIDEYMDYVRNYELTLAQSNMSALDTQIAICLNVFYHSYLFWEDAYSDSNNPWHNLLLALSDSFNDFSAGKAFSLKGVVNRIKGWVEDVVEVVKDTFSTRNIVTADLYGAAIGCEIAGVTGGTSIPISAALMSAIAPIFMN